jgi:hypothetical protein
METPKVYIASSWKNVHAVKMLTDILREMGYAVIAFTEQGKINDPEKVKMPFEEWVWSEDGEKTFIFDTMGATKSDAVIYIGPSGCDAWAEIGAAWASGIPVVGLHAKGEQIGVNRRMVQWVDGVKELLYCLDIVCTGKGKPPSVAAEAP